jgi:hypothetical protein
MDKSFLISFLVTAAALLLLAPKSAANRLVMM